MRWLLSEKHRLIAGFEVRGSAVRKGKARQKVASMAFAFASRCKRNNKRGKKTFVFVFLPASPLHSFTSQRVREANMLKVYRTAARNSYKTGKKHIAMKVTATRSIKPREISCKQARRMPDASATETHIAAAIWRRKRESNKTIALSTAL
jgi:hypothetical protein